MIRNENGFDFEKDKEEYMIHKKFAQGINKDDQATAMNKRKVADDDKYDIPDNLKQQMDEDVENREFQKFDKAQDDNRKQVANYFDEDRKSLEDRLRREGKLNEGEIENILNDYDMHTRDMAQMMEDDERRQKENFKRQLEARKNRRKGIFGEIDQLREERKVAKQIEAKELEEHFEKMREEENFFNCKILVDEEKAMRNDLENKLQARRNKLKSSIDKIKKTKDGDKEGFKKALEEFNEKERQLNEELNNERKRALMEIERKIAERKRREKQRISQMKPEKSSVDITSIDNKIEAKLELLKREADDDVAEELEKERQNRKIPQELAMLRKENDRKIKDMRDINAQKYEEFCKELNEKYDENKLGDLIDLNAGAEELQSMREQLADNVSAMKRCKNPDEKANLKQTIDELKNDISKVTKDGKLEEKMKENSKLLQKRAKLIEERETKKREFKWKMFDQEEKEREELRDKEREEWLRREKEAIDAVVKKYIDKNDTAGLAEVLDQVYGAGSKIYNDRLLDFNNKLQEKKARRLKYNFNANLDTKIHDIEELNRVMNPQLERLNGKKYMITEDEYKTQLKDLMMKENEKRAEIEALTASREQDSQSKTMLEFVDEQKGMVDNLNIDMKELREYAFSPNKIKDKQMKAEMKKLNEKYSKELEGMKKDEEEAKKREIEEIKSRFQQGADELERNRKDFEMLGMFEKKLDDSRENAERFKTQNKRLMMEQLNREKAKLGKELTEDEKSILMAQYERKMRNLNKALEREHDRQISDHSRQLKEKQRELEMKKRERELLLNSLSMYKDSRAQQIAYEDNFERLASMIEEEFEPIDHEAYSYKSMKALDLVKWKREADEYLDVLGGDVDLLERVRRIEKYVGNLNTSSYGRIKNLLEKVKK